MKKCRQCKEALAKDDIKLVSRRGYICNKCIKENGRRHNKKRADAKKEWRKYYA